MSKKIIKLSQHKRGVILTAYLVLMIIANAFFTFYCFTIGSSISHSAFLLLGFTGIANIVFAIAIWDWRRWGAYGFTTFSITASIITVMSGGAILNTLYVLIGNGLLILLIRPIWRFMK